MVSEYMKDNKLTTKDYWESFWSDISLPKKVKPNNDIDKILHSSLPDSNKLELIEIGCAPGGWLAYFHDKFNYGINGIEYASKAAAVTIKNMNAQEIHSNIYCMDFFEFDADIKYDVVFSNGFVEHFSNLQYVVNKLCLHSKNYIVTIIPNIMGINGFISKNIRPDVYSSHMKIDKYVLKDLHENEGMNTIFCDYVGGLQFIKPAEKNDFFRNNKSISRCINMPFNAFNKFSDKISYKYDYYPRNYFFSKSIMYVGSKLGSTQK